MIARVPLHEPFSEPGQQHEADMMGMYLFLATELMLFGGLIAVMLIYRFIHPEEVVAASKKLHMWIGLANTIVLLTSSFLLAWAVLACRAARARAGSILLLLGAGLGVVFLGLKAYEYYWEYTEHLLPLVSNPPEFASPVEQLWSNLYLFGTSLHGIHLTIGIALLCGLAWRLRRGSLELPRQVVTIEVVGLYWGVVDTVWVFLYPILYLAR